MHSQDRLSRGSGKIRLNYLRQAVLFLVRISWALSLELEDLPDFLVES